jgi:hypothetical protein
MIVEIRSIIIFRRRSTREFKSMGVLISTDLVLTCAHNIFTKYNKYSKRKEADEVCINIPGIGWQIMKPWQWIFPEEYKRQSQIEYDFALIKLTEKV